MKAVLLTAVAMSAFAANSLLCRWALKPEDGLEPTIDAASFTLVRIASGASFLLAWITIRRKPETQGRGRWWAAFALAGYAFAFSFAYLELATGTGALILFGGTQIVMLGHAHIKGDQLSLRACIGLVVAMLGLGYLLLPGSERPSLLGAILMTLASVGWGAYSIFGRGVKDPTGVTAGNFLRSLALVLPVGLVWLRIRGSTVSLDGVVLAMASGVLTSGVGYVIWYAAMTGLSDTAKSMVQLSVPVLAAIAGVLFLGEVLEFRLVVSGLLVLGGLGLALWRTAKESPCQSEDR
ncbi:MAG: DMT family transporter [Planctomycetota bacterium]